MTRPQGDARVFGAIIAGVLGVAFIVVAIVGVAVGAR